MFPFICMILDKDSFGMIIWTHVLTRLGRKWRHNKIHELMRMAEAMRRKDKSSPRLEADYIANNLLKRVDIFT